MRATEFGQSVPRVRSVGAGGDRKAAVVARSLRKLYGERGAVDGIDFEVRPDPRWKLSGGYQLADSTVESQVSRKSAPKEMMYFALPKSCAGIWSRPKIWRLAARTGS